jgi:hypothetical protein
MTWLARLKKQNTLNSHPTEPTKPGFVGSVGTNQGHIQKIEGEVSAANDPAPDTLPSDPDRWCWPHGTAMNGRELDLFTARLARFTDKGVILIDAESLADKLVIRDRDSDDRRLCLECTHLAGYGPSSWRCGKWHTAGIGIQTRDAQLPAELACKLQRCNGFRVICQSAAGPSIRQVT